MVFMPHWPIPYTTTISRKNLDPMRALMEALDNPHLKLPPTIHIAGTNGKGSCTAYLKSIFENAGYKAHVYTSPHLIRFNERIVLAGQIISDEYLFQICERIRLIVEKFNLNNSFFEITTAAAFIAFTEVKADVVILETGLGGRLDATNIVPFPLATIITTISYDHMDSLGYSLSLIAKEKAGIIKPKIPCIIGPQVEEVSDILISRCIELDSLHVAYGYDYAITKNAYDFAVYEENFYEIFPFPALKGDHQIINASIIIAFILSNILTEFTISIENIQRGLHTVSWPARLQEIKYRGKNIIIDGAHNTGGAQVLAIWMKENLKKPINMILGMTKNRDAIAFTSHFKDIVDIIYCVRVMSEPSSYMAEKLSDIIQGNSMKTVICENLSEAIIMASSGASQVVLTGSLFLAADALKLSQGIW